MWAEEAALVVVLSRIRIATPMRISPSSQQVAGPMCPSYFAFQAVDLVGVQHFPKSFGKDYLPLADVVSPRAVER